MTIRYEHLESIAKPELYKESYLPVHFPSGKLKLDLHSKVGSMQTGISTYIIYKKYKIHISTHTYICNTYICNVYTHTHTPQLTDLGRKLGGYLISKMIKTRRVFDENR